MIGKITTGSCFKPLINYLLKKEKSQIIGGNIITTEPNKIAQLFQNIANCRPTTAKPVKHYSIAFAPSDGYLDNQLKAQIAEEIVVEMGFTSKFNYQGEELSMINNQYLVVAHDREDPSHEQTHDHDHIHIAINLINFEGKRVNDGWDKRRLEKVLRQIEQKYNLTPVASSIEYAKNLSEKKSVSDESPAKPILETLEGAIRQQMANHPSFSELVTRMKKLGVNIQKILPQKNKGKILFSYNLPLAETTLYKLDASSSPAIDSTKPTPIYTVDSQKQNLLAQTKLAIASAVAKNTADSPDYFVFAQRMINDGVEVISYRTAGGKRSGRYKLKYRYGKGIEIRANKELGGSLSELTSSGKIKFAPEMHYLKPIPETVMKEIDDENQKAINRKNVLTNPEPELKPNTHKIEEQPTLPPANQKKTQRGWEL